MQRELTIKVVLPEGPIGDNWNANKLVSAIQDMLLDENDPQCVVSLKFDSAVEPPWRRLLTPDEQSALFDLQTEDIRDNPVEYTELVLDAFTEEELLCDQSLEEFKKGLN